MVRKDMIHIFRICAVVLLSAVMTGGKLAGIEGRIWVVWLSSVLEGAAFLAEGGGKLRRRWTALDCLAGGFFLWNVLRLVAEAAEGGDSSDSLLGIALALLFFLISWKEQRSARSPVRESFLNGGLSESDAPGRGFSQEVPGIFLLCVALVYLGLLRHFLVDSSYVFNLRPLLEEGALAPFLLLVNTGAMEGYCREEGGKRLFCLGMALAGWLLLFLDGNVIGILLGCLAFPVSILLHRPEKEFVRRTMQMASAFFFLLSNMPLLVRYAPLVKTGGAWSLEDGVCLNLALALAGVLFFSWWDRLPEGRGVLLHGFQKGLSWALAGTGLILFLLLIMGERLEGMGEGTGINLLGHFSAAAREYCAGHNGSFYDGVEKFGLIGGVWVICIILAAVQQMGRRGRRHRSGDIFGGDTLILAVCLAQAVFFSQQAAAAPLYAAAAARVLYFREPNRVWGDV